jgi:hypothetical protein
LARHLEVEAGWSGVAERSGVVAGISQREVEDRTDRWGPLGGDRGRRRHTGLRKREKETYFGQYATVALAGMGRVRARPAGEKAGDRLG